MSESTAEYRLLGYVGSVRKPDRESNDWHTPERYVEAARTVLGQIDLDPFSSEKGNQTVKARQFFTEKENALHPRHWSTEPITVWMNPPYSRGLVDAATDRLIAELPQISAAIVLVNNATETRWFQKLLRHCSAFCFPDHRIAFVSPDHKRVSGNTRGQAFFYFGNHPDQFVETFQTFGAVCTTAESEKNQ
jgi:phage N-6-adenine-methyltransferase